MSESGGDLRSYDGEKFGVCSDCGDEFQITGDDDDPFTSISVSYHDEGREDFAVAFCQDCGDDLLAGVDKHERRLP